MKRYPIVMVRTDTGFCAHSPDVPGFVATGATEDETRQIFREALEFHLEGLRMHGDPLPEPSSMVEYVEVSAA